MDNNHKAKILVVEDEDSQRMLYKEYLEMEGFLVLDAADGQQALDIVEKEKDIDMILLDLMLPKVDGVKVLERIRENPATKHIIIYMMTVLNRDAVIKKAYDLGADGYLIKDTMNPDDIKREILLALETKKR